MTHEETKKRITILETQSSERWDAHDKRSEDIWGTIQMQYNDMSEKTDKIVAHLGKLQCGVHTERMSWLKISVNTLWAVLIVGGLLKGYSVFAGG